MLIIPAIDLRDGRCVRLVQGDFNRETSYDNDPVRVAKHWINLGTTWLHIVDLDGARAGRPVQLALVKQIVALGAAIELGGGLRSIEDIGHALDGGVARVVLGTAAIEHPSLMNEAVERFGRDRVVLGVDARNGLVAVRGWEELSSVSAVDVIARARDAGIERVIYTDIDRDGMLSSPNYAAVREIARLGIHVIASGGVARREHLQRLASIPGVEAAIVGKALYERTITIEGADDWFEEGGDGAAVVGGDR